MWSIADSGLSSDFDDKCPAHEKSDESDYFDLVSDETVKKADMKEYCALDETESNVNSEN